MNKAIRLKPSPPVAYRKRMLPGRGAFWVMQFKIDSCCAIEKELFLQMCLFTSVVLKSVQPCKDFYSLKEIHYFPKQS